MKAIRVSHTGGPDVLEWVDVDTPTPSPGQVVVKTSAIGVNYIDTYHREGRYPLTLPFTPGQEGAGVVTAVGPDVPQWSIGDRVCWAMVGGSYAEYVTLPADYISAIPESISDETAAAVLLQGLTAHYLVTSVYPVKPGTTSVVHAAAGGVGLLLTQMVASHGGVVIGTTSSDTKADRARAAGAAHVIRYDKENWASVVDRLTDGVGVDVVYDGVGQFTFEASLASLRPRGLLALYGAASGPVEPFDLARLGALGSLVITRPSLAHFMASADERNWRIGEVFEDISAGKLSVSVAAQFPLEEAAASHRAIESRDYSGKILLIP